jgi:hypothetical protein
VASDLRLILALCLCTVQLPDALDHCVVVGGWCQPCNTPPHPMLCVEVQPTSCQARDWPGRAPSPARPSPMGGGKNIRVSLIPDMGGIIIRIQTQQSPTPTCEQAWPAPAQPATCHDVSTPTHCYSPQSQARYSPLLPITTFLTPSTSSPPGYDQAKTSVKLPRLAVKMLNCLPKFLHLLGILTTSTPPSFHWRRWTGLVTDGRREAVAGVMGEGRGIAGVGESRDE